MNKANLEHTELTNNVNQEHTTGRSTPYHQLLLHLPFSLSRALSTSLFPSPPPLVTLHLFLSLVSLHMWQSQDRDLVDVQVGGIKYKVNGLGLHGFDGKLKARNKELI